MAIVDRPIAGLGATSPDERVPTIRQPDLEDHLAAPGVAKRLERAKALAEARREHRAAEPPQQ
jgi:hypothetical protein